MCTVTSPPSTPAHEGIGIRDSICSRSAAFGYPALEAKQCVSSATATARPPGSGKRTPSCALSTARARRRSE
jgi:hypothetical protein